ncbi:MAG: HAMP domain-containing sensor histidine kinase [Sphaerobacter sp.]|nr:HAMP domain-containing sensor histidine kinase [Sphaerobacter sp.]
MRAVVRALRRAVGFAFRLYRRRLSVQLIFSHLLVVLLTAVLIELVVAGGFIFAYVRGAIPVTIGPDWSTVDAAATMTWVVGADALRAAAAGDAARLADVQERLRAHPWERARQLAEGIPSVRDTTEADLVAVVAPDGRVVATSDPTWAPLGQPVEAMQSALASRLARRGLELAGAPSGHGNRWLLDGDRGETVVVYPVQTEQGAFEGIVVLHRRHPDRQPPPLPVPTVAAGVASMVALTVPLLALPALLVAVPLGIARARRVSRRVSNLAEAADAMAQGDLERRVAVQGVDEIARLGERFNEMIESLARTDRARKAFIANVSHELRTPVAVLRGHIERLLARHADDPGGVGDVAAGDEARDETCRSLAIMHQEVLTLERLINDLFTLARLEEATLRIEPSPVAIDEVARTAVEGVRPVAWDQRKVSVESLVPSDLPRVLADRTRLQQIFGNLLYNALRHTPEGGLVVITAQQCDGVVEVAVSDTGGGIPAEALEAVFQRHVRLGGANGLGEASGLGLAIVKQLVEAQGGAIAVESVAGEGTTFRFTLPIAPKANG